MAQIPNDLLNVIADYTTTQVTFDLVTLSRDNWRLTYSNGLWKQKLRYETRDQLVDAATIEANKGRSTNTWWRYYLAKNRTFWGPVMFVEPTTRRTVTIDEQDVWASIGTCEGDAGADELLIAYQTADLRIWIKTHWIQCVDFRFRIRTMLQIGYNFYIITERNEVYYLSDSDERGTFTARHMRKIGNDIVCIGSTGRKEPIMLRRSGELFFLHLTQGHRNN